LIASAALAKPGPIAAAASAPVDPASRVNVLPSGSRTSTVGRLVAGTSFAVTLAELLSPDPLGEEPEARRKPGLSFRGALCPATPRTGHLGDAPGFFYMPCRVSLREKH
jgi:hypothetical protein